jgi:hypothetical protein
MTKGEEEMLIAVKVQHLEGRKDFFFAWMEKRDGLRKRLDEVLFKRRCWAATLANQVFALRADIAHVRHQLRVGWKEGEPLPEELNDARRRSRCAYIMNQHIDRAHEHGAGCLRQRSPQVSPGTEDASGGGGGENP